MRWMGWGQYDAAFQVLVLLSEFMLNLSQIYILAFQSPNTTIAETGMVARSVARPLWVQAALR